MSYSYLKNVFPNYEDSIKTPDIYNSITTETSTVSYPAPQPDIKEELNKENNDISLPQRTLLENFNITGADFPLSNNKNQDNLKFYNLPYIENQYPGNPSNPSNHVIEGFESPKKNSACDLDCDLYIKHINECNKCRSVIVKQFGIETDRIKNEEIMEVVSYLIFGLFVLLLIDSLKNSKS